MQVLCYQLCVFFQSIDCIIISAHLSLYCIYVWKQDFGELKAGLWKVYIYRSHIPEEAIWPLLEYSGSKKDGAYSLIGHGGASWCLKHSSHTLKFNAKISMD